MQHAVNPAGARIALESQAPASELHDRDFAPYRE
jgi:hypothetical protein